MNDGYTVKFTKRICVIELEGRVVAEIPESPGLYRFGIERDSKSELWHKRLGHPNFDYQSKPLEKTFGKLVCINGKHARTCQPKVKTRKTSMFWS